MHIAKDERTDAMKRQDQDDPALHNAFSADYEDAAPRTRRRIDASTLYRNVFALLALSAAGFYVLTHRADLRQPLTPQLSSPQAQIAASPTNVAAPTVQTFNAPDHAPQTLANCIKPGNVIDASVINCRYGELPRPTQRPDAQGMVSAEYLAQYKANTTNRQTGTSRNLDQGTHSAWVRQWDGRGIYLAQWTTYGNRINGSSVCANHRSGSIEYRECRKGAKVYFKEQCREWEKRWESGREDLSKAMEERYCSAANGFGPMG